jgi:hypothetical protein
MRLHKEGTLTRLVERQTSKTPSMLFLGAAGASIVGSLVSWFAGRKQFAVLLGEWVPTFLLIGMYNKFVKEAT